MRDGALLEINLLHDRLLERMDHDFVIGEAQPEYVVERIGGWVNSDRVY